VFCDVDLDTHNLDPKQVECLINERTSAILGVHVWGRPCDIDALTQIAARHRLRLFFDAAHALGSSYQGQMLGSFGDLEVFSFHATKVVNAFEGGAICTNDAALAQKLRLLRNFGFSGYDQVDGIGINAKMTEVSAAMGLTSLESLGDICATNQKNYEAYLFGLRGIPGLRVARYAAKNRNNYHYIVLECDGRDGTLSRDELVAVLKEENVLARRYFFPGCHQMEPYRSLYRSSASRLLQTERLTSQVLSLPNGSTVTEDHVGLICRIIRSAFDNCPDIRSHLQGTLQTINLSELTPQLAIKRGAVEKLREAA
jgi:dTDP-4-amino-4,6-dideoxygalactose transaminase